MSKTRQEAVKYLASTVSTFINDRCVGDEYEEETEWFHESLRALGVTDQEIKDWA